MTMKELEQQDITYRELDDDGHEMRTGTLLSAASIITALVIGPGVLSLAWAIAQLGWIAGPFIVLAFSLVTYMSSTMLADTYRYPDPVTGNRRRTYSQAVDSYFGNVNIISLLYRLARYGTCAGTTVGYCLTASISMVAVFRSNCYHRYGHDAKCEVSHRPFMVGFGFIQLLLSQAPNFPKLSAITAAVMSLSYASIGSALCCAKYISDGIAVDASITGVRIGIDVTVAEKVWKAWQAIGDIAFSYIAFSMVVVQVQDTLKSNPPENKVMKKAIGFGISLTTLYYLMYGCIGYAAFGNNAPGNIFTDFGLYEPFWLVDFANVCVAIHLIAAYQVFAQPVFDFTESMCQRTWPKSDFINRDYPINIPYCAGAGFNWFRLVFRTAYVSVSVGIAVLFPYYNAFLGLLGAMAFLPLTVYFPINMYLLRTKPKRWSWRWTSLKLLTLVCLLVSLAAGVGSIQGLIHH